MKIENGYLVLEDTEESRKARERWIRETADAAKARKRAPRFKVGDLVKWTRAGGRGGMAGGSPALILEVKKKEGEAAEYRLKELRGCSERWVPEEFISPLEEVSEIADELWDWLAKLEQYQLEEWDPVYRTREALRIAVQGLK